MSTEDKIKIAYVNIDSLVFADYNPRSLNEKQKKDLTDSLKEFGFVDPVIVNKFQGRENIIVGGHMRTRVAKEIGMSEVPVIFVYLPIEKEKELNIRLNKNTGEFDLDEAANHFEYDELIEYGFTDDELDPFYGDDEEEDGETEGDDDTPDAPTEPITVLGDIYELGEHRVMCGDSTMIDDVEKLMAGEKADMLYTDPPYGISIVSNNQIGGGGAFGKGKEKIGGKKISAGKYREVIGDNSTESAVAMIQNKHVLNCNTEIIWGGNYYSSHLDDSSCWVVWDKKTGDSTFSDAELAWTNQKTKVRIFEHRWSGMCKDSEHGQKRVHPTQKPIALAEWCFDIYNNPESVIDLFLGSGTTLIACEKTKRKCYGMELDPKYCDVIVKRYIEFCNKNNRSYSVKRNGEVCKDFDNE